ncbi:hypothetical protein HanPI659440_Chr06g0236751 [Helianthus annuus]|nr:hypothetical protein HanPI659440_Chr06g0236751 [Helianthus annuus]
MAYTDLIVRVDLSRVNCLCICAHGTTPPRQLRTKYSFSLISHHNSTKIIVL